ncbi:hypothetical protein AB0G04_31875 [Actinoplanes sp. NPDC023801]|uniref:SCO7613 C-terminal domain-containing membrane protein n=1 Tax=Actinoplanes sp. NPDC023801 TaxID=3154595 RepID=UPI0033F91FF0
MTTSYPCPRCGAAAALPDGCPACGAGPDPEAAEVIRLDEEIAGLTREWQDARALVTELDRRLHDTRARRNQVAARVVARRQPVPAPQPSPAPPVPVPTATGAFAEPVEPKLSTLTVQNVLFTLGGLLLVVAAAVFTAVAWAQVGVTGRALLLAGATAAVLAVPPFAVRRGLTAAAETLAAVGLLMILLDGYAAWAVGLLGIRELEPSGYAAAVLAVTAAIALGYSVPTRLRGPRIAALLMAQPVFPLLAAAAEADLTGWSLACTATAALDVAVLRFRPARFAADGPGVVTYVCGLFAVAVAGVLALGDLAFATGPRATAVAGLALLLPPAVVLVWALLARLPVAQSIAAALLVVATGVAGARWAWTLHIDIRDSSWQASRLALLALLIAAAVALLPRRLPQVLAGSAPPGGGSSPGPAPASTAPGTSATPSPSAEPASSVASATDAAPSAESTSSGASATHGSPSPSAEPASPGASATHGSPSPSAEPTSPGASSAGDTAGTGPAAAGPRAAGPAGSGSPSAGPGAAARVGAGPSSRRRVPVAVGNGAWVGALLVGAAPAITVLLAAVAGAIRSAETAGQVFGTPMGATVSGPQPDMLVATLLTAGAYALLLPRRTHADLGLTALAAVGFLVPAAFGLPWWTASVAGAAVGSVALIAAARSRTLTDALYRIAVCLTTATHAVIVGCGQPEVVAAVLAAFMLLGTGTAMALRNARRGADVGAGSLTAGLLVAPPAVWLALFAAGVPVTGRVRVSLAVAAVLCATAHLIGRRIPGYGRYALGVALLAASTVPIWALPADDPAALYAAAGLLLIVALLPLPGARGGGALVAALPPAVALLALTATDVAVVLLEPWAALDDIWSGLPPVQSPVTWSGIVALAGAAVAAAAAGLQIARSPRAAAIPDEPPTGSNGTPTAGSGGTPPTGSNGTPAVVVRPAVVAGWAVAPFVAVIVPLVFAAAGAGWPAVPIAGLVTGLAGLLALALAPARHTGGNLLAVLFGALVAAGFAGSAAGHGATIAALGLVVAASGTAGLLGRLESDRIAGWTAGSVSVVALSYTIADLVDAGPAGPPLFILAAAAVVIGLEWVLSGRRPVEARAPFVAGHASALVALLITDGLGWAALVCKLWALVLTVRAMRPGETRRTRFRYAIAAGSTALAGWWLLLSSRDVGTTEIYTLPAAVLAVVAGWFARRGRPELPSWTAYGPALAAAFLPTLAVIANSTAEEPHYLRRLLLGVGALLVLLAGARARLQAPVVTGGGTLLLVALHELIQFWDLLPRWVPLAVGGLLLVGIATTMEQRRRDLARLRAAITRMA